MGVLCADASDNAARITAELVTNVFLPVTVLLLKLER